MHQKEARGWLTARSAISVIGGIALFVFLIWKTGPADIRDGVLKVGWMFPVIVALGGLRFLVRAIAWTLCIEPPHRLNVRDAFAAVLAGDALGNATPLGPVVGEPAKAAFVRKHLPAAPALTALALENVYYTVATAAMIAAGTVALLFVFDLRTDLRHYSELAVGLLVLLIFAAFGVLWARPKMITRHVPFVVRPAAAIPAGLLELTFHALGVLETHLTMMMILPAAPPLLVSFILETASRLITVVFKFIPLQVGVAESGLGIATELMGMGLRPGVTFSIVRKVRILVWASIGALLLVRRGITPAQLRADPELPHPTNP